MIWNDRIPSRFDPPASRPKSTFCSYLAGEFIAQKGFKVGDVSEVKKLAAVSDVVLTHSDGKCFNILCLIDQEKNPNAIFNLDVKDVLDIGEGCQKVIDEISRAPMPVFIRIIEIGYRSTELQELRLSALKSSSRKAKVSISTMIVDTALEEVWSSDKTWLSKGAYQKFVERLLRSLHVEPTFIPQAAVMTQPPPPTLTFSILAALVAVFTAEIAFGIGHWTELFQPTVTTLVAFGGMMPNLVLQYGQWYRLLSGPFLNVDAAHLVLGAICLFFAGQAFEALIGRAWFGVICIVGALCGSWLSLVINPPSLVSVGASGAIMALFAAMMIASAHFRPGAIRSNLQIKAIFVLVPSLLPLASALGGQKVDYAAHLGGVMGGAVVGLIMLKAWPQTKTLPGFRQIAGAIAVAAIIALTYPLASVLQNYQIMAFTTKLIPPDRLPSTNAEMKAHAAELIVAYPHDPRPRFLRAADLADKNDMVGAEREARAGLVDEDLWRSILPAQLGDGLRVILAIAISKDRPEEAVATARSPCMTIKDGPMRKLLDDRKLCAR